MSPEKPLFIHLIGFEGCGHHGVFPIFEALLQQKYGGSDRALFFRCGLRPFIRSLYYENSPKHICVAKMVNFLKANPGAIIVEDNSYPSGQFRKACTQWNFAELHQLLIPHCNVRYVHIRRNIFNTINSHPNLDGGLLKHAANLVEIGHHIDEQFATLKANGVEIAELEYDRIEEQVADIAALTDCGKKDVERVITAVFRKSDKDYRQLLTDADIAAIADLFGLEVSDQALPVP